MATGTAIAGIIASAGIAPGPTPATTNPAIKTAIGISQTRLPEAATIFLQQALMLLLSSLLQRVVLYQQV